MTGVPSTASRSVTWRSRPSTESRRGEGGGQLVRATMVAVDERAGCGPVRVAPGAARVQSDIVGGRQMEVPGDDEVRELLDPLEGFERVLLVEADDGPHPTLEVVRRSTVTADHVGHRPYLERSCEHGSLSPRVEASSRVTHRSRRQRDQVTGPGTAAGRLPSSSKGWRDRPCRHGTFHGGRGGQVGTATADSDRLRPAAPTPGRSASAGPRTCPRRSPGSSSRATSAPPGTRS